MAWCKRNRVDFVFGLTRNSRLVEKISVDLAWAEDDAAQTGTDKTGSLERRTPALKGFGWRLAARSRLHPTRRSTGRAAMCF